MNYYCYIAGMPDVQRDNPKSIPAMDVMLEELSALLSKKDMELLNVFRRRYDNANLLSLLNDRESEINPLGVLSRQNWMELFEKLDDSDETYRQKDTRLLPYMQRFLDTIKDENNEAKTTFREDRLASLYYKYGMKQKNAFISKWFEFNLNINNILTALMCRKHGWNIQDAVVGDNIAAKTIRTSASARDFNLKTEIDYYDTVASVAEIPNLIEREHRIDQLKWQWLEEQTVFEYFSIERILKFWLQCELMHRWDDLSVERGTEIFRQMIDNLKKNVKF